MASQEPAGGRAELTNRVARYLDDDSFLNVPRLLDHLAIHNSPSLAMGFMMETLLDWSHTHTCELCEPCEPCRREQGLREQEHVGLACPLVRQYKIG